MPNRVKGGHLAGMIEDVSPFSSYCFVTTKTTRAIFCLHKCVNATQNGTALQAFFIFVYSYIVTYLRCLFVIFM